MLKTLACALLAVAFAAPPHAQSKFTLKVHTGRGQIGYDVNSTLVIGEKPRTICAPMCPVSAARMEFTLDDRIAPYFPAPSAPASR